MSKSSMVVSQRMAIAEGEKVYSELYSAFVELEPSQAWLDKYPAVVAFINKFEGGRKRAVNRQKN